MIDLLGLLTRAALTNLQNRHDLILENAAPKAPPPPLRTSDRIFRLLVWRLRPDWRRHLLLIRPDPVVRLSPKVRGLICRMWYRRMGWLVDDERPCLGRHGEGGPSRCKHPCNCHCYHPDPASWPVPEPPRMLNGCLCREAGLDR
jgi:hypothetical protein